MFLKKYKINWFFTFTFLIILLSIFLRFYHYWDRFALAYDQAHNAVMARYAINNKIIPLLGPFSSGGPFQTSGIWYWFVMFGTFLYPASILSPWLFLTFTYVIFVLLIILFAKKLVDKKFALIVGLITAVSTSEISHGVNLTNQSPQALLSLIAIWLSYKYIQTKKTIFVFLSSLTIGIAAGIHLEGVALIPIILVSFFISETSQIKNKKFIKVIFNGLKVGMVSFVAFIIPWVPVFIADSENNFYNTMSMLNYYSSDQAKVPFEVLGRRWLTFITEFIPHEWALITGGFDLIAYMTIFIFSVAVFVMFRKMYIKKKIYLGWSLLIFSFIPMLVILRYTRAPLFSVYLVFLHPFILLFTGWAVYFCYKRNKFAGIIILLLILSGSLFSDYKHIKLSTNNTYIRSDLWRDMLYSKYPNQQFAVYDYKLETRSTTLPFVLLLQVDNKIDDNGMKIGFFRGKYPTSGEVIFIDEEYDLSLVNLEKKEFNDWALMNPKMTFDNTEYWYKND